MSGPAARVRRHATGRRRARPRPIWLVCALIAALAGPARAAPKPVDDDYYAGTEAFRAGDLKTAIARFDAVRARIERDHPLFAPVHYNLGRCAQLMVERGQPDPPVCEGVGWFDTFLAHADERRSEAALARARSGRALLSTRCTALTAPPPAEPKVIERVVQPPPPDTTRWWLAGGAAGAAVVGGVALVLAADADADAEDAFARYADAETETEAQRWAELVREAEGEATTRSVVGLVALAGALGLGVAALIREGDARPAAAAVGPGAMELVWRF